MGAMIVLCTTDKQELAEKIANALVETGEAACVNIIPGILSIYRWEGNVCRDAEQLLLIKTTQEQFEAVRSRIRILHAYETPEIIAVPIVAGDADYLKWLQASVAK